MPTSGFEVRGRMVRQRSRRFASIHFVVDRWSQQFTAVRHGSPQLAGVAVRIAVKGADDTVNSNPRPQAA
jgi:hypothetical protein